jgi:hypothetical protein
VPALLPDLRVSLIAPEPLLDDRAFLRLHNRIAKQALTSEAIFHWATRIPKHFQSGAASKYGYQERKPAYNLIKKRRYGTVQPLVRTGETRDTLKRDMPEYRIGGRAAESDGSTGQLRLTMTMRLPFGTSAQEAVAKAVREGKYKSGSHVSGDNRPGVTIDQMKREIAAITLDEAKDIAASFGRRYQKLLTVALKSRPKLRKRIISENLGAILGF